jgi:hypothetical protein
MFCEVGADNGRKREEVGGRQKKTSYATGCDDLDEVKTIHIQEVEAPRFQDTRHMKVVSSQPYAPAVFSSRKYSWYSFLLEAKSTPGPQCDRKDYVNEKFQ